MNNQHRSNASIHHEFIEFIHNFGGLPLHDQIDLFILFWVRKNPVSKWFVALGVGALVVLFCAGASLLSPRAEYTLGAFLLGVFAALSFVALIYFLSKFPRH